MPICPRVTSEARKDKEFGGSWQGSRELRGLHWKPHQLLNHPQLDFKNQESNLFFHFYSLQKSDVFIPWPKNDSCKMHSSSLKCPFYKFCPLKNTNLQVKKIKLCKHHESMCTESIMGQVCIKVWLIASFLLAVYVSFCILFYFFRLKVPFGPTYSVWVAVLSQSKNIYIS